MSGTPLDLTFKPSDQIVRAGAGAGKTYNLVECVYQSYLHFKKNENRTPRFVMTTFTRKATHELRERMVLKACEVGDPAFFDFVADPGHLHISTIHGVLTQFLREFGHLHELDIGIKILESDEEQSVIQSCLRSLLVEDPEAMTWLDSVPLYQLGMMLKGFSEQFAQNESLKPVGYDELLTHAESKFKQICSDFLEWVEQGLETIEDPPYSEYLLGLRDRVTHFSWENALSIEIPSPPRKTKRETFPVEYHEEMQERIKKTKGLINGYIWDKDVLRSLQMEWERFSTLGKKFSYALAQEKMRLGQMSMSDLETISLQILKKSPFLGQIFSENFDFWLIDEFQDTSGLQLEILNHLVGKKPRFVVGDPQQSIYFFRGAQSELFVQEISRVKSEGGRVAVLDVNYRSDSLVLDVINKVMTTKPQFSSMSPFKLSQESGVVAHFIQAVDLADELRGIALKISKLISEGQKFDGVCVLGRTHRDLFEVASYLKNLGLPTHVHSPSGFWERYEIKDALSLLKFLVNPHDNLNLLQVLRAPWLKVQDEILKEWMKFQPRSLWNQIKTQKGHLAIEILQKAEANSQDLGVSIAFTELLNACDFIAWNLKDDPAGRVEANIWKLIAKIKEVERKPGGRFFELFNVQNQESDAVAATEPNCINLMTIHGSKGLEFDHVFIPRAGRRPRPSQRSAISFAPDNSRFAFSLKDEDGESMSTVIEREWIEDIQEKEFEEVERWLYVALTRAKKSFSVSWSEDEFERDSWVDRFSLNQEGLPNSELLRGPFPEIEGIKSSVGFAGARAPFQSELDSAVKKRSSFTQIKTLDLGPFNRARTMNVYKSQVKGIDWHRRFEGLKYGSEFEGTKELNFLMELKSPPFLEILKTGQAEWGFQTKVGDRILEGQVDMWGYDPQGQLWVLDYKTGSSKSLETSQLQVEFYLWVLKKRESSAKSFKWAVIYPLEQKVFQGQTTEKDFKNLEAKLGLS